ncbi:LOW QUALITY PROTEIN: hypothetical protein Cgig2_003353 [Carnegiea gigantea]|uniref:tRNA(His) guanylyltransferase n=1 Tax=Carnegiea gigantea TaxID=171969 RepID=A0A9Q1K174_9CARY|nr:LOW QUALITY PROTEIN: hypothetical protein Cgig2_003353 [Carnegiea gigantea]
MANSKYEYVKSFEAQDKIMLPNLIVARIDGRNFRRFSEIHQFEKPNDRRALKLMKACAAALMEDYPDIVFSYGFSDEYSFIFKKDSKFYQRRESKILSLLVSFFTAVYTMKWKEFFQQQDLLCVPSFRAQVISCPTLEVLQTYLAWRQNNCNYLQLCCYMEHMYPYYFRDLIKFSVKDWQKKPRVGKQEIIVRTKVSSVLQFDTCFWKLVESGKNESEAHEILKVLFTVSKHAFIFALFAWIIRRLSYVGFCDHLLCSISVKRLARWGYYLIGTQKQERNELLFQQFGINYKNIHAMFRQGTCLFKAQVEDVIKYKENGDPVKRLRRKVMKERSENIASKNFWNQHPSLVKELGSFDEDIHKIRPEYVESFHFMDKLLPSTWIAVRVDGCHFHRFSDIHAFEKPNDEQALNLMNSCAAAVVEEFKDIMFAYGVSDEYSFVLKKESKLYERDARKFHLVGYADANSSISHFSGIVSAMVSFFSSMYIWKWNHFFPQKELRYSPSFDGRAVCYPSVEILRDYLSWRQVDCEYIHILPLPAPVDRNFLQSIGRKSLLPLIVFEVLWYLSCTELPDDTNCIVRLLLISSCSGHINNQYNTCFWMLVKCGKGKCEAQNYLKGTQTQEKNDLLMQNGVDYNALPDMFRRGSCVFWDEENNEPMEVGSKEGSRKRIVIDHCNIIDDTFWVVHPWILGDKYLPKGHC